MLHWIHHLETALPALEPDSLADSSALGSAVNEFYEIYSSEKPVNDKAHNELILKYTRIQTADCYEPLLSILSHGIFNRLAEPRIEGLGALGNIVNNFRNILEELNTNLNQFADSKVKLETLYGAKRYRCTYHACYYFHEGFTTKKQLEQHMNRHEKPFCCTEMGCTRMYIGWSTEKELKKHIGKLVTSFITVPDSHPYHTGQYHPSAEALSWKFPHIKKPPATFQCELCRKQYTRASTLGTHRKREHGTERPFTCKVCGKGFVRKFECERHESIHKNRSTKPPEGASPD